MAAKRADEVSAKNGNGKKRGSGTTNGNSKKHVEQPASQSEVAGLFGFSPVELAIIVIAVVAAVVAGLALGGMFT